MIYYKKEIFYVLLIFMCNFLFLSAKPNKFIPRKVIYLNGEWFCEPGSKVSKPDKWRHKVPVPGLVDLITPRIN